MLIAVDNSILSERVDFIAFNSLLSRIDIVCCRVDLSASLYLYIFAVYIPPKTNTQDFELFFSIFEDIVCSFEYHCFLIGDFNVSLYNSNDVFCTRRNIINNASSFLNLEQYSSISNCNNRILDIVFSDTDVVVKRFEEPLVSEDRYHHSLSINLCTIHKLPVFNPDAGLKRYNFKKTNLIVLYDLLLQAEWSPIYDFDNVDDACCSFYTILYIFDQVIPYTIATKPSKYPVWYSFELVWLIKKEKYSA